MASIHRMKTDFGFRPETRSALSPEGATASSQGWGASNPWILLPRSVKPRRGDRAAVFAKFGRPFGAPNHFDNRFQGFRWAPPLAIYGRPFAAKSSNAMAATDRASKFTYPARCPTRAATGRGAFSTRGAEIRATIHWSNPIARR